MAGEPLTVDERGFRATEAARQALGQPPGAGRVLETTALSAPSGQQVAIGDARGASDRPDTLGHVLAEMPNWLLSMIVHLVGLLILALLTLPEDLPQQLAELIVTPGQAESADELEQLLADRAPSVSLLSDVASQVDAASEPVSVGNPEASELIAIPASADDLDAAAIRRELDDFGLERAPNNDLLASVGAAVGSGLEGRGEALRGQLAASAGASEGSEKAVAAALKWLAEHQGADGGWSFNHQVTSRCKRRCRDPGAMEEARVAATALALLPFLGAGQTHRAGRYRNQVKEGIYFLKQRMRLGEAGGSLYEPGGRMYSHGLASIALCEAYGMTLDRTLKDPAQAALDFVCHAQDPHGGGWRYEPQQRGDTSMVGWMIMALKSGHMAYLRVPRPTVQHAEAFLDSVQADGGATYGYTDPGFGEACTAIGLLCRMHLGWNREHESLRRGVAWLDDRGPSPNNVYYNYYATQVMRHWEGPEWKRWNGVMRDSLVNSQAKSGHEAGSWFLPGDHGSSPGGRLYCTAMAAMILEVYYRHMPLYQRQSTEAEFAQ